MKPIIKQQILILIQGVIIIIIIIIIITLPLTFVKSDLLTVN